MMGVGEVTEGWDWMRREARIRVCLVLSEALSAAIWGWVKEVGWRVSEADQAASYPARVRSGQVAGVGTAPEVHGRGVYGFLGIAVGRDVV